MDNTKLLIDQVLVQHYQLPTAKVASATYTPLRARVLRDARAVLISFWGLRDWTFKYVEATLTVTGGSSSKSMAALTYPWENEGNQGSVFLPDQQGALAWVRLGQMLALQKTSTEQGTPRCYSVRGLRDLLVYPAPSADTVLTLSYETSCPVLVDTTGATNGLDRIPEVRRESVIYEGTVLRQMLSKGDVQSVQTQAELYNSAIFDACCAEAQGKPEPRFMPRYSGAADVFVDPW